MDQQEQAKFFCEQLSKKDARLAQLEAENERLRAMVPSEEIQETIRDACAAYEYFPSHSRAEQRVTQKAVKPVYEWLARLEAKGERP